MRGALRGLLGALALWGGGLAHAGVPVVYDGDAAAALALAAARSGLPRDQLEPVPLDSLLSGIPRAIGGATLRHCAGEPSRMDEIRAARVRAETSWREGDVAAAMDHLDLGMARLGCLVEKVDGKVATRLFQLRGGLLAREGEVEAAKAELGTALSLQSEINWDDWMPGEGRELISEIRHDSDRFALDLAPPATLSGPWLDGMPPGEGQRVQHLRPGLHLLQVASTSGLRSAWLTLDGNGALVIPGSFRRPVLEAIADPETRGPVEQLIVSSQSGFSAAYVVTGGGLWLISQVDGRTQTQTLVEPPPPPPPPETGRKKKDRK